MYLCGNYMIMDVRQINFEELFKLHFKHATTLDNEVMVFDQTYLSSKHLLSSAINSPSRIDAAIFILCKYGGMTFSVDYKTYNLSKGSMLILTKYHVVDNVFINNNCESVVLIISRNFMRSAVRGMSVISKMMKTVKGHLEPVLKLEDNEMRDLTETIDRIQKYLKNPGHAYHSNIVQNEISVFFMEFLHFFVQKMGKNDTNAGKKSRGEEITRKFIELLIEHFKEQHEVSYYAKELCMTPVNLLRTITATLGKTPIQCIGEALVSEAKTLLRNPNASTKQVADDLNFGDQSSFGKFFKKHTGMTPVEYRNRVQGEK